MASTNRTPDDSFFYTCVWNIAEVGEAANTLEVHLQPPESVRSIVFNTSVSDSNFYLNSEVRCEFTNSPGRSFLATFHIRCSKNGIFRTLSCTLRANDDRRFHGSINLGNLEEFQRQLTTFLRRNTHLDVICEVRARAGTDDPRPPRPLPRNEPPRDIVEPAASRSQMPRAHRAILAVCSPVFAAIFRNELEEENEIPVEELDFPTLQKLVNFMHADRPLDLTADAHALLIAADKYHVTGLKEKCEASIANQLTIDNAVQTLRFAHKHDARHLERKTKQFISSRLQEITETAEFRDLDQSRGGLLRELVQDVADDLWFTLYVSASEDQRTLPTI